MTIFDLPGQRAAADLQQWQPILDWLGTQLVTAQPSPAPAGPTRLTPSRFASSPVDNLVPAQKSVLNGDRMAVARTERIASSPVRSVTATGAATRPAQPETVEHQQIPSFLKLVKC
jgi:hypothetical protein